MNNAVLHRSLGAGAQQSSAEGTNVQTPWVVYAICAVPSLVKLLCYPTYPGSDDAFIHLTMVHNITHSLGWGINPGEPVNLSSSPLYTLLLALLTLVGLPSLPAGELLSAVSGYFALVFLYGLLKRLGLRPLWCLTGLIIAAFNIFLWRWNGIVMETTLSLFLLTFAYWLYHGADPLSATGRTSAWRYVCTGIIVGLATLTRFELALALGCMGLCEIANRTPARWLRSCGQLSFGFLAVVVPWFVFCQAYFHGLLPTTFYAKTSANLLLWNPNVALAAFKLLASSDPIPLAGLFLFLGVMLARRRPLQLQGLIRGRLDVFLFPFLLTLFYYLKIRDLESAARYFLPALQMFAVVLACLFDGFSQELALPLPRSVVYAFLTGQMLFALIINQVEVAPVLSRFRDNYWSDAQSAAAYLKSRAATRRARVLVEVDIGMLSYYAGGACYFIDGGALATPSLLGKTLAQKVAETQPDFVAETLGYRVGAMSEELPSWQVVWHRQFHSHSLSRPKIDFVTNIYENTTLERVPAAMKN